MKRDIKKGWLIIGVLFCLPVFAGEGTALLKKTADKYRRLIPFEITFKIKQSFVPTDNEDPIEGQFYLDSLHCFRLTYPDQVILYDGQWLWSLDKGNDQVIVESFDPRSSLHLIYDLLSGNFSDFRVIKVTRSTRQDSLVTVHLDPADENNFFEDLSLVIDHHHNIERAAYQDFQGNQTIIQMGDYQQRALPDSLLYEIKSVEEENLIDLRPQD